VINNKIQFLLIFIITVSSSNVFGIDYFWLKSVPLEDDSRLGGVEVGKMSDDKVKKFFNKGFNVFNYVEVNGVFKQEIKEVKLGNELFIFDQEYDTGDDHIGIRLSRSLAIKSQDAKMVYGVVAIPSKYNIEEVTFLNLKKAKFSGEHKSYLDAIRNSKGIIPEKTAKYMLANTDSLSIYEDTSKSSRFAIIRNFAFLDQKVVYSNFHGFSPFVNETSSPGFLLKINGKEYLLADFGFSVQREGWVEEVDVGYFLINLEEGKGYLPMHLREEK
jgi:hypothetical protein